MTDVTYVNLPEHEIKVIERDFAEIKSEEYLLFSQYLFYNKISGEVIRQNNSKNACYLKKDGQFLISLKQREYCAGYVSWCLNTGYYPKKHQTIIYLDGNKKNVKFDNLSLIPVPVAEKFASKKHCA